MQNGFSKAVCISSSGVATLVLSMTRATTKYISIVKNKRKIKKDRTVDFKKEHELHAYDVTSVAERWLKSPIKMTLEVERELKMIIGMQKNKVVGKYETAEDAPKFGTKLVTEPSDLATRSLENLNALYNSLAGEGSACAFETVEEATVECFKLMEAYEVPEKVTKEKVAKEKKEKAAKIELVKLPRVIDKAAVITVISESNPRGQGSGGANWSNYVTGDTVEDYLKKDNAHLGHLRWDAERRFITLQFPEIAAE